MFQRFFEKRDWAQPKTGSAGLFSVLAFIALIFIVSCAKDNAAASGEDSQEELIPYVIEASISDTKALLSGYDVLWQTGDRIAVFDGTAKREFVLSSGAGTKSASFSGEISASATKISAVSPYSAAGDMPGSYTVPSEQNIGEGMSLDPEALIMMSAESALHTPISFSNPCGLVRMTVPPGTSSCSISFLERTFSVRFAFPTSSESTVEAILPAATYEDVAVALNTNAGIYVKASANPLEVKAGKIIVLGNVKGKPASVISNAQELKSYLESSSKTDAYVVNDIDLVGASLSDTATVSGIFDGRGHSLKNWTSAGKPIFAGNKGTVKNIKIDSSCQLSFGSSLTGHFGFLVCDNDGVVSGCENKASISFNGTVGVPFFGALVGNSSTAGSQVIGCSNSGTITITGTPHTGTMYLGGVLGRANGKGTLVKDCINEGNISYTVTAKNESNLYYGGVLGAANTGADVENCTNKGDVIFITPTGGAAVVMGGVVSYSSGLLKDCSNYGDVKYLSDLAIKGTVVGGVAGYSAYKVTGCRNDGDVVVNAKTHEGRNTIGTLDVTKDAETATSTATVLVGGILGVGAPASATTTKFELDDCHNNGSVSYTLATPGESVTTPASAGRHCVGGIVGDASGPVTSSTNNGDVSAKMPGTCNSAGFTMYVGGIAGSNYFSRMQTDLTITDCSNSGNIVFESANSNGTNNTLGGIVGWPGKESGCTSVTSGCTNTGDITASGNMVCRIGGIHGASGRIENCTSSCAITCTSTNASSAAGGIAGFHSGGYQMNGCHCSGSLSSTTDFTKGIGGLVGNAGNSEMTLAQDSSIDMNLIVPAGSANFGMVVGHFNGITKQILFGTTESPLSVDGSLKIGSASPITITSDNRLVYLHGDGYDSNVHIFNIAGVLNYGGHVSYTDGQPAAGVAVSDGFSVVVTDKDGNYSINPVADARYIYISCPSDAKITVKSSGYPGCPDFFQKFSTTQKLYDFTLTRIPVESEFMLFAMADPQAHYNARETQKSSDAARFKAEAVPDLNNKIKEAGIPCYGVTLGDIVYSEGSRNSNNGMSTMRSHFGSVNMPIFQTMGNHDYSYFYSSSPLSTDATTSTLYLAAQRKFEDCFGPVNLSFNRGNTHVVCMRDIIYNSTTDASDYDGGFNDDQWNWLQADLAVVPKTDMVIICVHIPLCMETSGKHVKDALNLLKQYKNATIFSGHTHYYRGYPNVASSGIYEHIHSAVCGQWWWSRIEGDGCPNGYTMYRINGNEIKNARFTGYNDGMNTSNYQMRIYKGDLKTGGKYAYFKWYLDNKSYFINVFSGDSRWKVKVYENGVYAGTASQMSNSKKSFSSVTAGQTYNVLSPSNQDWWAIGYHIGFCKRGTSSTSYYTNMFHMWKWTASSADAKISVEATDPYGNVYTCNEVIDTETYPEYIKAPLSIF